MLILTANENLLERLVLLVQNSPRPAAVDPPRARSVLLSTASSGLPVALPATDGRHKCPQNWMVLMAKKSFEEHQMTLSAVADIYRLSMTLNNEQESVNQRHQNGDGGGRNPMRILMLKKEHAEEDEQCLMEHMEKARKEWMAEWGEPQAEKLKRFGQSDAQEEHLARSQHWAHPAMPTCALAYFDDPDLLDSINAFFGLGNDGFQIVAQSDEEGEDDEEESGKRQDLFGKPPALHWTNYPRDSEVQVTFKFTFPRGSIPDCVFRKWTQMGRQSLCWDYEYEWTNGILLRAEELVKVTITRCSANPNIVEVSGRIDTEEAAEEEEQMEEDEGEDVRKGEESGYPLKRVWPYLVRVFQMVMRDIDERRTLPFSLSLVFIGDIFFTSLEGAPRVPARSLDAVQTLGSIQRIRAVRFRVDQDHIHLLNLFQCFPTFYPTKLADFSADHFPLPPTPKKTSAASSSTPSTEGQTTGTSMGGGSATQSGRQTPEQRHYHHNQGRTDRSPSCIPAIALNADGKLALSPANSLHVERQLSGYKNRGRRVSFGVIHAIPSVDGGGGSGHNTPRGAGSPSPLSVMGARAAAAADERENGEARRAGGTVEKVVVENVVDEMLQRAIDEVLVTD